MNELVLRNQEGKTVTTSLIIADVFSKEHDKVCRDIKSLGCSKEFSLANFGESVYTNIRGKQYPMYEITKDGFSMLVMGYTGAKAFECKEKFINEFNKREILLKNVSRAISVLSERVKALEQQAMQKKALPLGPIGGRLDGLLKHYHLNKNSLSVKLGITSNSVITRIVNDRRRGMSLKNIQKIMVTFPDINPEWLILGKGRMLKKKPVNAKAKELALFQ